MANPSEENENPGLVSERTKSDAVVLVVEDDRLVAKLFTVFLEDSFTVRTAQSGDEALELLDDQVDVALIDRRLDTWEGEDLLTVIRDRQIDCKVALVTGVTPDFDIVDMPIDAYLEKPITREELHQTIDELLFWHQCDVTEQELLALISRRITLEEEMSEAELHDNEQYAKLQRRIEEVKNRLDTSTKNYSIGKYRPESCPRCDLRWDVQVGSTLGFIKIASNVWKCTQCGHVEHTPDPSSRYIARR